MYTMIFTLLVVTLLVALCSANKNHFFSGECTACPSTWYQSCGKDSKYVGYRNCGVLNWGCEMKCERSIGCGLYISDGCEGVSTNNGMIHCKKGGLTRWSIKSTQGICFSGWSTPKPTATPAKPATFVCPAGYTDEKYMVYNGGNLECGKYNSLREMGKACDNNRNCEGLEVVDYQGKPYQLKCLKEKANASNRGTRKQGYHFCRKNYASRSAQAVITPAEASTEILAPVEASTEILAPAEASMETLAEEEPLIAHADASTETLASSDGEVESLESGESADARLESGEFADARLESGESLIARLESGESRLESGESADELN